VTKAAAVADLESLYDHRGEDVIFASFLSGLATPLDDEQLAELIELDGRKRLLRGLEVTLERYLSAVPGLRQRPDALDAAIEVSLRALSRSSRVDGNAVEKLVRSYPELAEPIREAASLNNALWSTTGLRDVVSGRPTKSLPCSFGPLMPDGEPRYELRSLLGIGATGQVYLAVDRRMSEPGHDAMVAVKVLPRQDTTIMQRVRVADEATKARRIDHPNVVRVIDRGTSDDLEDFIVSEFVDGCDLAMWLQERSGDVPVREAVALVAGMARGMQAAHSAGLVHCDLKPSNILMTKDAQPKVADFGIAMRIHEAESELSRMQRDRPIGNLAFISPEQYRMEDGAFSAPSDIYALGGVLYLLLTNQLPNGASVHEIADHHSRREGVREIVVDRRGVDRDLLAICRRALAPAPQDRYNSAGSFADDLESWLRHEPLYWTRPSIGRVSLLWMKRQPLAAVFLIVLVTSLAGSGAAIQYFASRAEIEEARQSALLDGVRAVGQRVAAASQDRLPSTRLLEIGWWYSYLSGQDQFGAIVDDDTAWRATFLALERWVSRLEEAGEGDSLNAIAMKKVLAFWCIGDGQLDRAEQLIAQLRATMKTKLSVADGDPWWLDLDAYELMAGARRALADAHGESELRAIAVSLEQHEPRWRNADRGSPQHLVLLETLQDLYGPRGINDPELYEMYVRIQAEIEAENLLRPVTTR